MGKAEDDELQAAAKAGDVARLRAAVGKGANREAKDSAGYTPLANAVCKGHADVAVALVELGADLEARDKNGNTPLANAAKFGRVDAIRFLLEHGSDS